MGVGTSKSAKPLLPLPEARSLAGPTSFRSYELSFARLAAPAPAPAGYVPGLGGRSELAVGREAFERAVPPATGYPGATKASQ
ncbi:hypothetical protein TeGR_g2982, partial [Tetraparma gracilis]